MDQQGLRQHVISLLGHGKKIEAIRDYHRAMKGIGLAEAKAAVERIEAELRSGVSQVARAEDQGPAIRERVEGLLREKKPVDAIRVYRLATGCDLRTARQAVEAIGAELLADGTEATDGAAAPPPKSTEPYAPPTPTPYEPYAPAQTAFAPVDGPAMSAPKTTPRATAGHTLPTLPTTNRPRFAEAEAPAAGRVPLVPLIVAVIGLIATAVGLAWALQAR